MPYIILIIIIIYVIIHFVLPLAFAIFMCILSVGSIYGAFISGKNYVKAFKENVSFEGTKIS